MILLGCKKQVVKVAPSINSVTSSSSISGTTATIGGSISTDGGDAITARGVVYGLSANPTISDNKTSAGSGIGTFSSIISGLTPGQTYYFRTFATNSIATYKSTYGALYNWFTVNTSKLCPTGWHVPSDAEWTTLTTYLGGLSVAGGKLKSTGTTLWQSSNTGATNESGFTALPGGYHSDSSNFYYIGLNGLWWSSTGASTTKSWGRRLYNISADVASTSYTQQWGMSVRCLKD